MFKAPMIAAAAGALLVAAGTFPAAAQYTSYENCTNLYNRTMAAYQGGGVQSGQYAQLLGYYNARCLSGSSAAPAYSYGYAQPYGYSYAQPVDPGAAIVGGIVGGVVGGALGEDRDDYRYRHDGYRDGYYRR